MDSRSGFDLIDHTMEFFDVCLSDATSQALMELQTSIEDRGRFWTWAHKQLIEEIVAQEDEVTNVAIDLTKPHRRGSIAAVSRLVSEAIGRAVTEVECQMGGWGLAKPKSFFERHYLIGKAVEWAIPASLAWLAAIYLPNPLG